MNRIQPKVKALSPAGHVENVLESYYGQLIEWGSVFTRGDAVKTEDLVHDFCLHFALTRPDLSAIENLDGYLYRSLKNIYLSGLAYSSREAEQFVSIPEFDSIQFALVPGTLSDSVQRQNDLRRICCHAVWRKDHTKNASYFILRFFHGYHHKEIADLSKVPISVLYSKLKNVRAELRSHLENPGKLLFIGREGIPVPPQLWTPLSSVDLFKELRQTILNARKGICLTEEELIAQYDSDVGGAVSCSFLSHLVSCERCLAIIDQHFRRPTLRDREPLDDFGGNPTGGTRVPGSNASSCERVMRSVRRRRTEILDHRPRALSIAVNGKILASHEVQAPKSILSARVDRPENANFVEVFSEQRIRLALISIEDLPPGASHEQVQRVALSDGRWLYLSLLFDGMGLSCEVTYFDPALVPQLGEQESSFSTGKVGGLPEMQAAARVHLQFGLQSLAVRIRDLFRPPVSTAVGAWAVALTCVFVVVGYFVLRDARSVPALDAHKILDKSIQLDIARLKGQTEHQVLQFEKLSFDGSVLVEGSIDFWRDGDGTRYMRRLYDSQHRLIGAEWAQRNGQHGQYSSAHKTRKTDAESVLLAEDLWKQDVSSSAFKTLAGDSVQVQPESGGYQVTALYPQAAQPHLVSATLVLDRHLHPIQEVMRVRSDSQPYQIRFVQADYECRPSGSVPDTVFDPWDQGLNSRVDRAPKAPEVAANNVRLAQLYIDVLYQLTNIYADTNEPIDAALTANGHIRLSGTLASDDLKRDIQSRLRLIADRQLLDIQLVSSRDALEGRRQNPVTAASTTSAYDVAQTRAPADVVVRAYFEARGLSGASLDSAVSHFSDEAIDHARRALQHGAALSRLGGVFPREELTLVSPSAQQQWTDMVSRHASGLDTELRALDQQFMQVSPTGEPLSDRSEADGLIKSLGQFSYVANQLLVKTQILNRSVGALFAEGGSYDAADAEATIRTTSRSIPLQQAVEMTSFTSRLSTSMQSAGIRK